MAQKSQQTNLALDQEYQDIYCQFKKSYDQELGQISLPFNFNILDAQCGTIKENSHTNILMKLLEYKNQYGYVFLEDFIKLADFDIQINESEPVIFKTEYFDAVPIQKPQARKTKQGRIDGLIYQQGVFALIIENKVNEAPNQDKQLMRYIESVIGNGQKKGLASVNKVYVVFLTKDGVETPDHESVNSMRQRGILNEAKSQDSLELISGPRYFACSYRFDILPWLENEVQPLVFQKEQILNTGLVQYIDFLKGMLDEREEKSTLWDNCRAEFNKLVEKDLKGKDLKGQNEYLYNLYLYLKNMDIFKATEPDEEKKKKADCINLLQNIVRERVEEPMAEFLRVTKEFFTKDDNPLIMDKDYIISHPLNFAYINIRSRDKKWPKGFVVGWFPTNYFDGTPTAHLFFRIPKRFTDIIIPDQSEFSSVDQKDCVVWRRGFSMPVVSRESLINEINKDELLKLYNESGIIDVVNQLKGSDDA